MLLFVKIHDYVLGFSVQQDVFIQLHLHVLKSVSFISSYFVKGVPY